MKDALAHDKRAKREQSERRRERAKTQGPISAGVYAQEIGERCMITM